MAIPFTPGDPLTVGQIRELDVLAIEHVGIPGLLLMENAGRTVAEFVYRLLANPAAARVVVLAGVGNNGGDGFVVARHLDNAGVAVSTVLGGPPERLRGDAATNYRILQRLECRVLSAAADAAGAPEEDGEVVAPQVCSALEQAHVIVDALLGTGAAGPPRGTPAGLIRAANAVNGAQRVAIDIPSGLSAEDGVVHDPCFRADATITLAAGKLGFDRPAAQTVLGRVVVADVGIPRRLVPGRR